MSQLGKLEVAREISSGADEFYDMVLNKPQDIPNNKLDGVAANQAPAKVGSISSWKYFHDGKTKVSEEMIEAMDSKNHSATVVVVGGDLLNYYKSFKIIMKIITASKPKATVHAILKYEKIHDDVEDPYFFLQMVTDNIKDVDAYLLAHK